MGKRKKKRRSVRKTFSTIGFTFEIYWGLARWVLVVNIVTSFIKDLSQLIYAFIYAGVIDSIIGLVSRSNTDVMELIKPLSILLIYSIISELNFRINQYTRTYIRSARRGNIDVKLFQHFEKIGMIQLEDPNVANKVKLADDWLYATYELLDVCIAFITYFAIIGIAGYTLFKLSPLITIFITLVALLQFIPKRYYLKKDFLLWTNNSEQMRKGWDDRYTLSKPESLGEIYVTGGYQYFQKRYLGFWNRFTKDLLKIQRDDSIVGWLFSVLQSLSSIFAYFVVLRDALNKVISIGDIVFYIRAIDMYLSRISQVFTNISQILDLTNKVGEAYDIFEIPEKEDGHIKLPRLTTPPSIQVKNLWFKYPGSKKYIFKDLDLDIKSGEKVAIVGHNGAGKTTLVKILARLYDYQKGVVRVDGQKLTDLKTNDWYKNIGILFQEFNFYNQLTAGDNIYVGKPIKKKDQERIEKAAKAADAHDFIMKYKRGYNQVMSEKYKNGIRPSTGQKQKIGIARFIYRDAPLAIFDEPTAAIDAVSEYNIFNNIYNFFEGKTVIIISHRFSTVRNADRIIVLDHGEIIEQGSHTELMKMEGTYAKGFRLQAEGYQ